MFTEFWVIYWIHLPTHSLNCNTAFNTQDLQLRRMSQYSLVLQHKIRTSGGHLWTRKLTFGPLKCGTFFEYAIWRPVSLLTKTDLYGVTWLVTVATRISVSPVIKTQFRLQFLYRVHKQDHNTNTEHQPGLIYTKKFYVGVIFDLRPENPVNQGPK